MVVPNMSKREEVLLLIAEKDKIEKSIADHGKILLSNKNVGMSETLVDTSGFPRNDIDVYQVRSSRHAIICLQNDLKRLMKEIEKGLELANLEMLTSEVQTASTKTTQMRLDEVSTSQEAPLQPFLTVNLVSPNSPAEKANLQLNDKIIEFGTMNITNCKNITEIGTLVNQCKDKPIRVKILRGDGTKNITLTPTAWQGRGLLGCNIIFIEQ